jgi:hypothetical protein
LHGATLVYGGYPGIVLLFGWIYWLFGDNPVHIVLFNALLGGLTSVLLYSLMLRAGTSSRSASIGAVASMMVPQLLLYTALLMKEVLIAFLFVLILRCWQMVLIEHKWWAILVLAPASVALLEVRVAMFFAAFITLVISLVWHWRRRPRLLVAIGGAIAMLLFAGALGIPPAPIGYRGGLFSLTFVTALAQQLETTDISNSASTHSLALLTKTHLSIWTIYILPIRFAFFLLNPPPWATLGEWPHDVLRMGTALLVYGSMPAMFVGAWVLRLRRGGMLLWLPPTLAVFVISFPTPFLDDRIRVPLLPLMVALAVVGFVESNAWKRMYPVYIALLIVGTTGYLAYKSGVLHL